MTRLTLLRAIVLLASLMLFVLAGPRLYAAPQHAATYQLTPSDSISKALKRAQPGDTIQLADGLYKQDVVTDHGGQPGSPITLRGSRRAIIAGAGEARIIQLFHPYLTLDGFTVDGTASGNQRDKGIYVLGQRARTAMRGLRLVNLAIRNIGGECVRLRYYVQGAEIANNQIGPCGLEDFPGGQWGGGGKNGEGVYIGTAPEQRGDGKSPDASPDQSDGNWIHDNRFDTRGNECVDIKEDASGNLVERNTCAGQRDGESAGLDSRGNNNVFRFNTVTGSTGAGIRFGGDSARDGTGNYAYGNTLTGNAGGGFKLMRLPQAAICDNSGQLTVFGTSLNPGRACNPSELPNIIGQALIGDPLPPLPTDPPTRTPRIPPTATQPTGITTVPATATLATTVTPPSTTSGWHLRADAPLVIDATRGQLAPDVFTVRSEGGRAYLTTFGRGKLDQGEKLGARYDLVVDTAGRYYVWVLGRGHGDDANSVFLRAGDGPSRSLPFDDDGWRWERARSPVTFAAGQTSLSLFPRERGTDAQTLVITRDQHWTPPAVVSVVP